MSERESLTLLRAHLAPEGQRTGVMWYAGLDVHQAFSSISIRNGRGVVTARATVPTTASDLRAFFAKVRGRGHVACESGAMASWLVELLTTRFRRVIVTNARANRLLGMGSKHDRLDADRLSELLRVGAVAPVYVGDRHTRELRQAVAHYRRLLADQVTIVQRVRAIFRESGVQVVGKRGCPERVPIRKLPKTASRQIVSAMLRQLATVRKLQKEARAEMISLASQWPDFELLQTIPYVGEVRAAELIAIVDDPWRFKSVRRFWSYAGFAIVQRVSADQGPAEHSSRAVSRRLRRNRACQPRLHRLICEIAMYGTLRSGLYRTVYEKYVESGKRPAVARFVLGRKVAAALLSVWRDGEPFRSDKFLKTIGPRRATESELGSATAVAEARS